MTSTSTEAFHGISKDEFVTSFFISAHPLINSKEKARLLYFSVLEYFVALYAKKSKIANARLLQYRNLLVKDETTITLTENNLHKTIRKVVGDFLRPSKRERFLLLFCDIAFIIAKKTVIKNIVDILFAHLSLKKQKKLNELFNLLFNDEIIPPLYINFNSHITQFRSNNEFISKKEIRILVTATLSAGKSTFINSIVGKPITRMAQEACTNNLCFIYNKPFEDNRIHLLASRLNLNATYDDLRTAEKEADCSIASFFKASCRSQARVCLIDTPGVNFALNREHVKLTRRAIAEETYDKLIYILNADYIAKDDEIKHLNYVYKTVPGEKVIFVLNKLDHFIKIDDSILKSIEGVKADLLKIGFNNPVICPFSAYFSLLLKMKQTNSILNEDELDYLEHYVKKFNKLEYNLSLYYDFIPVENSYSDNELMEMNILSGLYGFETILYDEGK